MNRKKATVRNNSQSVPSAGMRGGLGRTLLTAFLLLSILPLGLISFLAVTQGRRNLQHELEEKLFTIATLTESQVNGWLAAQGQMLAVLAQTAPLDVLASLSPADVTATPPQAPAGAASGEQAEPKTDSSEQLLTYLRTIQGQDPAAVGFLLVDEQDRVRASFTPGLELGALPDLSQTLPGHPLLVGLAGETDGAWGIGVTLAQPLTGTGWHLVALLDLGHLTQTIHTPDTWSQNGAVYLAFPPTGQALKLSRAADDTRTKDEIIEFSPALRPEIEHALTERSAVRTYENHENVPVFGVFQGLDELNSVLVVEQVQSSAMASSDSLVVMLIGATLAVVLLTALIAAMITRRVTLPIIELTATAVQIASGDLNQKVPAARRDEIGILARAFNVMTTKLRILYEDLEQKVKERTRQLQDANAKIRYRAMQLAVSAEVGRVVTSILEREPLLARVVELTRGCFQAYFVAIYLMDDTGKWAVLQAGSGHLGGNLKAAHHRVDLSDNNLVSQAAQSLAPCSRAGLSLETHIDRRLFPHTRAELSVPLKVGSRTIGVLDVHSTNEDAFGEDEIVVLQTLSGQISVAIENARAYEIERQAAEQLRDLEALRRNFLSNMSRELRMPLNNIIGFSRVILKGIDGPITDLQREDLGAIHESGQQLLVLINDILDIAQIEAGEMELDVRPVDLGEIAHSVIPTAGALVQGRNIDFRYDIAPDLPPVLADAHRLRQVLVKLLTNAAKFTQQGEIRLEAWQDTDQVFVRVVDTGIGIPEKDREKVFDMFHQLSQPVKRDMGGAGLGLTFSKEIIELHGGEIHLENHEPQGTALVIALPIPQPEKVR
jgi:signal transduction histidine kinase